MVRASALSILLISATAAYAAPGNWDHAANIKDAAQRLAKLHKREGSTGVLKFVEACYRTHLLASDYSKAMEACMAQDYMHTRILTTIYGKLPEDQRKRLGMPSPELIAGGFNQRVVTTFQQYKVSLADAEDFKKQVDTHGFPVFVKAVFPKGAPEHPAAPGSPAPAKNPGKNNGKGAGN